MICDSLPNTSLPKEIVHCVPVLDTYITDDGIVDVDRLNPVFEQLEVRELKADTRSGPPLNGELASI